MPDECGGFECAYYQMDSAGGNFRPDRCKAIFEKVSDRVFFATLHPDYDITKAARSQIVDFRKQGFSVILKKVGKYNPAVLLAVGHTAKDVYNQYQQHLKKRNDGTELH